ncbi:2-haloacid dehalogenase [Lewinella aquimaris]|uniref:2-haloacid dehalogenase n=1 Tax=Neolewinella aquimaris TaxID=1835722 RepID=A0A840E878_9BACT|nr:HAD family phosphatase [Neolewinella aquimaris]MBB4079507.1 2-haloacid dehalogenase [Neolewinella aquimaris]
MPHTIIFDLGNVLIGWQPRALFEKVFETTEEVDHFLANVATLEWNEKQDAGRTIEEGTRELIAKHPEFEREIKIYYDRWTETITGPITGTVEILQALKASGKYRLLALTNWSHELFPWARQTFPFLELFENIMVSGEVGLQKPDPAIYRLLHETYDLKGYHDCVFIDDSLRNVEAARKEGLDTIRFENPEQLRRELRERGVEGV